MMNTLITILIDIGFYLHTNWRNLTVSAVASAIGIIVGKRWGIRFAVKYIYKAIGIRKKDIDLRLLAEEVRWTRKHVERMVGEKWRVERGNLEKRTHGKHSLYLWIMKFPVLRAVLSMRQQETEKSTSLRRNRRMKEYLRKLGSRKFQALLVSLVVNLVSAVLFMTGTVDIDSVINVWMPMINMTIGTVTAWIYIWVEGSSDKASIQKGAQTNDFTTPIEPAE